MPNDITRVFVPFADVRKSTIKGADGKDIEVRILKGPMTDESLDLDQQIVDFEWARKAAEAWHSRWGNIREQHTPNAIGRSVEIDVQEASKSIDLTGKVVDPLACVKVDEEILQGWSVGIKGARTVKDAAAPNGRIVGGEIVEVSLVDHPANENCKVALVKSAKTGKLENAEQEVLEKTAAGELQKVAKGATIRVDPDGTVTAWSEPETAEAEPEKGAEADLEKRSYTDKQRAAMAKKGQAIPVKNDQGEVVSGRYPIADEEDLKNAISAFGRAKDSDAGKVKAYIKRRAKALGATDALPDDWKAVTGDVTKDAEDLDEHADSLNSAATAIRAVLVEEASENEPGDPYQLQYLVNALCQLEYFANSEAYEMSSVYLAVAPDIAKAVEAGDRQRALDLIKTAYTATDLVLKRAGVEITKAAAAPSKETTVEPETTKADNNHAHMHTHEGGTEFEYQHDHGHTHDSDSAHAEGEDGDHRHDHSTAKAAETDKPAETTDKTAATTAETDKQAAVLPDAMKAAISEAVTKAVDDRVKPLQETVEKMAKQAAPGGPLLTSHLLRAPDEVKGQIVADRVKQAMSLVDHPDAFVRQAAASFLKEAGALPESTTQQ